MSQVTRKIVGAVFGGAALIGVAVLPASAQQQDGLVNVVIGDVTVLQDVNVGVAAEVAANVCGVSVGPVAILADEVDNSGVMRTVCTTNQGDVDITQN